MYIYTDTDVMEYFFFFFDQSLKYGYQTFVTNICNGDRIWFNKKLFVLLFKMTVNLNSKPNLECNN